MGSNWQQYFGRTITTASVNDYKLELGLDDGTILEISDNGQCCCENRYMSTDDDVSCLVGGTLQRIEAKNGPNIDDRNDSHETCFVEVGTNRGFITLVNHNEHNGYYGGFCIDVSAKAPQ